ncbi:hypothetical protein O988_07056 [Pseudogymnoascus sp. VKM F-3808]|nr:hypothetical protein O988_07056 [Pseudogymnoascus sp. VKM F-3808]
MRFSTKATQHSAHYTREDHYNSYSSFVVIVFIVESSPPDSSERPAHHILPYAHGKDRYDAHSNCGTIVFTVD